MLFIVKSDFAPVSFVFKDSNYFLFLGKDHYQGQADDLSNGAYIEMDLSKTSILVKRTSFGIATRIINNGIKMESDKINEAIRFDKMGSFSFIFSSSNPKLIDEISFINGKLTAVDVQKIIKLGNPTSNIEIKKVDEIDIKM